LAFWKFIEMSRLAIVLVVALIACASATSFSEEQYQFLFGKWMSQFSKTYSHEHFFYRYTVFKANLDYIHEYNNNKASEGVVLAMNPFGDMTFDEFHATHTGYNYVQNPYMRSKNAPTIDIASKISTLSAPGVPTSVNWVTKGAVTPVKNQGQCGSCWAFSTTGSTEGAWFLSQGDLISLSEQQLVDCSGSFGNQGCNGGSMDQAFEYVIKTGGLCTEASYPYQGVDGTCKTCNRVVTLTSYSDVGSPATDAQLMAAVAKGPVSVAIEADQQAFQFYSSGVFSGTCGTKLDHGVLIVGYGTSGSSNYWLVKNSWGATWGAAGYISIVRGKNINGANGECGINMQPSYPIVD